MAIHMIGYDLNPSEGENYDKLFAALEEIGTGYRGCLESTWRIMTQRRATQIEDAAFGRLTAGTHVTFVEEMGEKGPQASTVKLLGKHTLRSMSCSATPRDSETGWEHFPHDADVGVRGRGPTPAKAFEQAALALSAIVTHGEVQPRTAVEVQCEAPDTELLFVEWLNSIIYEMAVRKMLFGRFAVQIDNGRLAGTLWGEPVDVERHAPACEPKGATYTALRVAQDPDGTWSAACIVDV